MLYVIINTLSLIPPISNVSILCDIYDGLFIKAGTANLLSGILGLPNDTYLVSIGYKLISGSIYDVYLFNIFGAGCR